MKKIRILIALSLSLALLCACGETLSESDSSDGTASGSELTSMEESAMSVEESTPSEETTLPEESSAPEQPAPQISVAKTELHAGEQIVVSYSGTDDKDWIGVYPAGAEPGTMNSLVWQYSVGTGEVRFSTSALEPGDYGIYLCDNDGYLVLAKCTVTLIDTDTADYGVKNAVFHAERKNGVSRSSVTVTPSSSKKLTYLFYWAKNGARLEDYLPIATVVSSGSDPFEVPFNDTLFMPEGADSVEVAVKQGVSESFFAPANDVLKVPASKLLFTFSVLSDLHIIDTAPQHISHLRAALSDIRALTPDTEAIFTVGDNTDRGRKENYELLMKTIAEETSDIGWNVPIRFTMGNHDQVFNGTYEQQLALFKEYTGMPGVYYASEFGGMKFLVLGSDEKVGEGVMHASQLDWLEAQLHSVGTETPVFLFLHQPLVETVAGSLYSSNPDVQYWYGFSAANDRFRSILAQYPNAILFTGHTHWTFESNRPILYGNGADASFVGCASVGYLWTDEDNSTGGSEGWYIEVYEDYILLKGREFTDRKWCAASQFLFPIK